MAYSSSLHILAFPFQSTGHVNPLMHLCKSLVCPSIGFKVTFVCTDEGYQAAVRARDLEDSPSSQLKEKIPIVRLGEIKTEEFVVKMGAILSELIEKLSKEGNPVSCILSDNLLGWVQDVANRFNIPRAVFYVANAVNDVIQINLPQLIARGFVPVKSCQSKELIDFLPGIAPMPPTDLPILFHDNVNVPFLDIVSDGMKRFQEAEFALCNTYEEIEGELISVIRREVKANYFCVGPCISSDFLVDKTTLNFRNSKALSQEDKRCLDWLDKQEKLSVMYVSFGSLARISVEQGKEVARGLESSGRPFLMVLRENLLVNTNKDSDVFYDKFIERTKNQGLVTSWAPQKQVLLHPAVGGFLTQCGWNSILEGSCSLVPMLAWPLMSEQNVICRQVVECLKIAIEVKEENAESSLGESLVKLIDRVMGEEGKQMRNNALELKQKASNAVSEGGSSHRNLIAFAEAVRKRISSSPVSQV